MSNGWPEQPIGRVCNPAERWETPVPGVEYRQIGVRLWGEGAYEREPLDGGDTKYGALNRVQDSDIIVNKIWARNGSVSVVDERLSGCYCSGEFPLFQPVVSELEPRWFYWITKTRWFWNRCDVQSRGTSGKNRIRPEAFLEIPIPLPSLSEQRRIVAKIEEVAAKIEEARRLRTRSSAASASLLSSSLGGFFARLTSCYESRPLGTLASRITDGPHKTPMYYEDGVPFVTVQNMVTGRLSFTDLKYISLSDHEDICKRCNPELGDVLYSKDGATRGHPCYVNTNRPFNIFVSVALIKPIRDKLDGQYLCHILNSCWIRDRMQEKSRGDMIPHIVLGEISRFPIPVPPISKQRQLVAYLDCLQAEVDALKTLQAQTQVDLDALLPSILDKAFKGDL